jgi:hypothetical protein
VMTVDDRPLCVWLVALVAFTGYLMWVAAQ